MEKGEVLRRAGDAWERADLGSAGHVSAFSVCECKESKENAAGTTLRGEGYGRRPLKSTQRHGIFINSTSDIDRFGK